ncbi:hypothetical protein N7448_002224 [Penicillium atrosanguineum]|uniref:Rhodopsin domain-containing protein n=1 Tax=Penicillium atrosanguineum TaxID=1132637 RepID=A0A9W9HDB9_9EURO|nr:Timeless protein [Penicillium atrosanguineum]KAJ5128503.1 hypothetical protein N7526_006669 [Penicillium atrosanguineum]KAJ5144832.1 hypothetical protein N7448_002224 [Penicillium atrosanguineum]KAJ5300624.1 Timeless protein [Penicillium atrosanguineum]KAJ5311266.1 hypothetical protein N7476_007126 [Penicillium atrosanguineum]
MGVYGGLGPMTNAVLWLEVVIFAVFVGLRLYTRISLLNAVGVDDYLVVLALIVHILYTIFVTIGTYYGLGQLYANVGDADIYYTAVKYELFSQVAGLAVIGIGKAAVGMFLLRIVRNKIQIGFIWACIVITAIITTFACVTVIVQCIPVEKSWKPNTPGYCWLDFSRVGYTVGSWFVAVDFSFAILPWFVVWDLNMKQKEKITVACGLSLGIFAGICGIVRTVALSGLNASEYIYDTVPMLIWSATESCVTIMCSSIPVLRPLYVRIRYGKDGKNSSPGNTDYKLPMYGSARKYGKLSISGPEHSTLNSNCGPYPKTVISYNTRNTSDETIIRDPTGIARTDEISVSYEQFGKQG